MKSEKVKEMLDSCYMAKRILDMLPKLPEGVLPSYVRYLKLHSHLKPSLFDFFLQVR